MIIAVLLGMGFGVAAAVFRGRWPEWGANGFSLFALSVPNFWLGILAVRSDDHRRSARDGLRGGRCGFPRPLARVGSERLFAVRPVGAELLARHPRGPI